MIVHTCRTMTVREYALYEADRDVRLLFRKWFRFIPRSWFVDDVQAFTDEFNSLFNSDGDDYLLIAWEQAEAMNRILLWQSLAEAIHVHTVTRAEMEVLAKQIDYKLKPDEKLPYYIEQLKTLTGREINSIDDIVAFKNELQRKIDKYNEKYNAKKETKKTGILDLFNACCRIMEVTHDYTRMTLWEFSQFKRLADEHARRVEAMNNKYTD